MSKPGPAKTPCASCPYRRDVPAGVWAEHEYLKLPAYDGETGEQALKGAVGLFYCHQRTGNLCAGWVGCHDMEDNLAVRFAERGGDGVDPSTYTYESPVPLFSSGAEAAAHGLSGIENPGPDARRLVAKLAKVVDRPLREKD
jgi:hypothetical protein